jgi:xanthine dehydrogenase molybdopterin-binding subunit B
MGLTGRSSHADSQVRHIFAGMMVTEMWIDRIARELGMTPRAVRRVNMYDEGDATHYGQVLDGCQVKPCFEQVRASTGLS